MSAIQEIFRMYAPEYLDRYAESMPGVHRKVIRAIQQCRSGTYGTTLYVCEKCHTAHAVECACGNRHCPTCQHQKAQRWLEKQMQKLLPCNYFLLTITLPQGLRRVIRSHQQAGYAALFTCAHAALKKLAQDTRFVGSSRIAALAALHTWGAQLQYHPHLHLIVPAGALAEDGETWMPSRQDLFVHTRPLARIFKAKFRDAMKKSGLMALIDPAVWQQDWVLDSQPVGSGATALRYLARYVFRVAISNSRIVSYHNHSVTFRYKDSDSRKWRTMTLDAMEFIRRFLQHVLPTGFMKIRHFGFLNANCAVTLEKVRQLVCRFYDILASVLPAQTAAPQSIGPKCPRCGHRLRPTLFLAPCPETLSG